MFNAEKTKNDIVDWVKEEMKRNGGKTAVIGVSGGKDSSIVAALCVEALGKENVIGVLMPQGEQKDIQFSYDLVKYLGIDYFIINIEDIVKTEIRQIEEALGTKLSRQAVINLPARIRMTTLYGIAQSIKGGRVTCNSNLSEDFIGFVTIYGDTAGAFAPIGDLTTDEVKEIGKILGLPGHLIEKPPIDGLTDATDEENFGFTYEILNKYIRTGICEDTKIREKIDLMHKQSRFKTEPIPVFKLDR